MDNFNETVKSLFDGLNGFVSTKTVIGQPMHVDGATLIPLIDVSFGVGAGAFSGNKGNKGAGGMNGKMSPTSVMIIRDGEAKIVNLKEPSSAVNKVVDMVPELIKKFTGKDKESEEVEAAVDQIKEDAKTDK